MFNINTVDFTTTRTAEGDARNAIASQITSKWSALIKAIDTHVVKYIQSVASAIKAGKVSMRQVMSYIARSVIAGVLLFVFMIVGSLAVLLGVLTLVASLVVAAFKAVMARIKSHGTEEIESK